MKLNLEQIKKELNKYIVVDKLYLYNTESYNKELLVLETEGEEYFFRLYEYIYVNEKYLVSFFLEEIDNFLDIDLTFEYVRDTYSKNESLIKDRLISHLLNDRVHNIHLLELLKNAAVSGQKIADYIENEYFFEDYELIKTLVDKFYTNYSE